jgi:hypothetical protein
MVKGEKRLVMMFLVVVGTLRNAGRGLGIPWPVAPLAESPM